MASRLVLGLERKTPGSGGLGSVGEEGSWGPLPGLPGDENSLAQPPGLAPYPHCGIQLEPGGSVWSLPAWSWAGIRPPDSWVRQPWEVLKGKLGLLDASQFPPYSCPW